MNQLDQTHTNAGPTADVRARAATRLVVIAGVDASDLAAHVVAAAARIVAFAPNAPAAELHLLHSVLLVAPAVGPTGPALTGTQATPDVFEIGRHYLEQCVAEATREGAAHVTGHLTSGAPALGVLQLAASVDADLIVVGSHSKGNWERLFLGSVAETLVRKATCPVLVTRPKQYLHAHVPDIAPPCPDCLDLQRQTNGHSLWCQRHAAHRPRSRVHYEYPEPFALGSMFFQA